jgi:hypothetical protein
MSSAMRSTDLTAADFSTFRIAGKLLVSGHAHELYNLSAQADQEVNARFRQVPLPFNHAPYEAILFAPLAFLSYAAGYAAWNLCSLALLAWMAWKMSTQLPELGAVSPLLILVWALVYWPNAMVFLQGQDSILLAALVTAAYLAMKQGEEALAGVILACGLFKFHLILPLLFCLLLNRQMRLLKGFCTAAAVLLGLSLAMIGRSGVSDYLALLASLNHMPLAAFTKPEQMPNLRGLLSLWIPATSGWTGIAVLIASVLALLGVVRLLPGEERGEQFDLFFACAMAATYAVSFNTYEHDMAILFPGLLLAVNAIAGQRPLVWKIACGVTTLLLLFPPLYLRLYYARSLALMCLPVLALIVLLAGAPSSRRLENSTA